MKIALLDDNPNHKVFVLTKTEAHNLLRAALNGKRVSVMLDNDEISRIRFLRHKREFTDVSEITEYRTRLSDNQLFLTDDDLRRIVPALVKFMLGGGGGLPEIVPSNLGGGVRLSITLEYTDESANT